jgi:hypothetical protein
MQWVRELFLFAKSGQDMKLTIHHLLPRLRMNGVKPPLPDTLNTGTGTFPFRKEITPHSHNQLMPWTRNLLEKLAVH